MDDFLISITLGEYIAAANARSFASFFADRGLDDKAASYSTIAADEMRHFRALREVVRKASSVPEKIRRIYKGSLLAAAPDQSVTSIFERMAVMHTVFEGAAFAYMSLLAKHRFSDSQLAPIKEIARMIMQDEARHMSEGFQAIDLLKKSILSSQLVNRIREQVLINAEALRDLPSLTIQGEESFQAQLYQLYDENVERNFKRVFR